MGATPSFVAVRRSLSFDSPFLAALLVNRGKQFGESPLVETAVRAVAVWLDPLGMLLAQGIVHLLLEFCVGSDFVLHSIEKWSVC